MNDDTRKLLKVFGVAVTDSEAEADKLAARAGQGWWNTLRSRSGDSESAQMLHVAESASGAMLSGTVWRSFSNRTCVGNRPCGAGCVATVKPDRKSVV